jgi:hypothetical protein
MVLQQAAPKLQRKEPEVSSALGTL